MASKSTTKKKTSKKKKPAKKKADRDERPNIPTLMSSFRRSRKIIAAHKKPFAYATAVYAALYFLFVRILASVEINDLVESVRIAFAEGQDNVWSNFVSAATLYGEATAFDEQSGLLYVLTTVIFSLAFIWMLRLVWAEKRPHAKEAFYQGMYPLVPFLLVGFFVVIQLLPFTLTSFVFQTAFANGLAISFVEKLFFVSILAFGIVLSAYLLLGSAVALYAVTVPGVKPLEARRTAKRMLKGRRIAVLKQAIVWVLITAVLGIAPLMAVIWVVPQIATVVAALLIVLLMPWTHLYFYGLYRDLLDG